MLNELIKAIKSKKELESLDTKFVKVELDAYFLRNPKEKLALKELNQKSKVYKKIIKEVRSKLRRSYGLFRQEKIDFSKDYQELLNTHSSTKERLKLYPTLYKRIFKITGEPKGILDLGCGINPLSFHYMNLKKVNYFAYDLSKEEIQLINKFFKEKKIEGRANVLNLLEVNKIKKLPEADLAFLFKMTDVLDKGKGHKTSEEIIKAIPSKNIVVSFPTLTISGKPMNHPRRGWMEMMCKRLNYSFKVLSFENEIFYVIKKN
jgi:hypothetical protein